MILNIIGLAIGLLVMIAGIYYPKKEKNDADSKKIYTVTTIVGVIIVIAFVIRWIVMAL